MEANIDLRQSNSKRMMAPFAFLLPAAVLIVVCLIGGVSPFGNATLISHFNADYINAIEGFRRAMSEGESLFYSFGSGLGEPTWGAYAGGFFSPVSLIALLFSTDRMADAFLLMTLVRMGIAGFTSYLLASSLNDRTELCLGFSVAYGGCAGFLICVFSPYYASAAVLLPAIGAAVLSLLKNGRVVWLAIAMLLFMVTSWQFFTVAVFFTAAVFVWGTNVIEEKEAVKTAAVRCAIVVAASLAACAVFAVPSILENAESGSVVRSLADAPGVSVSQMFSGLFMANELKEGGNAMLYCSVCTLVMLPVYLFNGKLPRGERVMAAGVLVILLLAQMIPALGIVFTGFTSGAVCESGISFLFCTCAVAFASRGLSKPSGITVGKALGGWALAGVIYAMSLLFGEGEMEFLPIIVTAGFLTLYASIVLVVMSDRRPPAIFGVVIMLCILAEAITAGAQFMISAKEDSIPVKSEVVAEAAATETAIDSLLSGWEITGGREGVSRVRGECDIISARELKSQQHAAGETDIKLLSALGIKGEKGWTGVTDTLFAVRYLISDEHDKTYTALSVGEGIGLYENKNALSVGFAASDIVLGVDPSLSSNPFTAQELLLSAALGEQRTVFANAQINEMRYDGANCNDFNESKLLTRYENEASLSYTVTALRDGGMYMWISSSLPDDARLTVNGAVMKGSDLDAVVSLGRYNALDTVTVEIELCDVNTTLNDIYFVTLDEEAFSSVLSILATRQLTFVRESGNRVRAVAETKAGEVILLTVPYSKNWTAVVDGKRAETYRCLNGLMAVDADEGQHTLSLVYTPEGFNACVIITAMAVLVLLCYVIMIERKNRNDMPPEMADVPMPVRGMEPVEEGNVIPVASPTLNVDLDFESEENTLNWL